MLRLAGVSASAPPLVTSGMALAMPPVPVVTPTPAPSRRNQVSSVKLVTPSAAALPEGDVVVGAVEAERGAGGHRRRGGDRRAEAAERLPVVSTAMTT